MTRRRSLTVLLAALALPVFAQQRDRGDVSAPTAETARLSGRVIEATAGDRPLARAIVTLTGPRLEAGRSVVSDDDGTFVFERVPVGEYTLSAARPGYLTTAYGAPRPGRAGTPIALAAGANVDNLTVVMLHGAAIDGLLSDVSGDPAPGMRVEAIRLVHHADGDRGESAGVAMTDDRGEFRIYDLPPGDYVLSATPPIIVGGMGEIGVPAEADVDALLAALASGSRPVRHPAPAAPGSPAPAPPIRGFSTPATFYPGVVQSGLATRITIGANESREGVNFAVQLSHAAGIQGVVSEASGGPMPPILVSIHAAGAELPVYGGSMSGPSVSVHASDHTFRVSNVPPGRYRLIVRSAGTLAAGGGMIAAQGGATAGGPAEWASADVDMGGDDIAGISLALRPALHVSGRPAVPADATHRLADFSSIRLTLDPLPDPEFGVGGLAAKVSVTAARDGAFTFPAVLPGRYRLSAALPADWWMRSATIASADVIDAGLDVGAEDLAGLSVSLSDRHPAIAGSLVTAGGRPATAYFMLAFSTDKSAWGPLSRRVRSARPSTAGTYELTDLPPGSYYLAALTDLEPSDLDDPAFLSSIVPAAVTVTLGEGERKVQDLRIGSEHRPDPPAIHRD